MTDILSATLEASPGTRGDKLPRIGSIWSNIDPVEKPEKKEVIENMNTWFEFDSISWKTRLYTRLLKSILITLWTLCLLLAQFICILYFILWLLLNY